MSEDETKEQPIEHVEPPAPAETPDETKVDETPASAA